MKWLIMHAVSCDALKPNSLNWHYFHSNTNKILEFEPICNKYEPFLESLQRIYVNNFDLCYRL